MICGGFVWFVVPDKTIWFNLFTISLCVLGFVIVKFIPDKKLEEGE